MSAPSFQGRHRWVTALSTLAVVVGLLLGMGYAFVALEIPPGTRFNLIALLVVVGIAVNFVGDLIEQRHLEPLRWLAEGTVTPTRSTLVDAALAVAALPELTFRLCLGFIVVGALLVSVTWWFLSGVPGALATRVGFIGLAIAPLTAALAFLVTTTRTRRLLGELCAAGLPSRELHAALKPAFALRQRLVVFAFVAVSTPLLLVIDLALARARQLVQLVAATPAAQLDAVIAEHRTDLLVPVLVLGGLLLGVILVTAWLSGANLGQPLQALAAETERLVKGQHGEPPFIAAEYETLAAASALAGIEGELLGLMQPLSATASELGNSSTLLGVERDTAARHRSALEAANGTTHQLARSAKDIAASAQSVSELARATLDAARAGRESSEGFLKAMREVREGNQAIADSVVRLNKRVQQVGRIIEFIDGIADRSDLLALNAELEGNKAGEVGRGFSLVASEMRRLAESVMVSTREIARLIDEIRDATNAAVMATEAGVKATDVGAGLAQRVGDGLNQIVAFANQSSDAMQTISLATAQQQIGTDQLAGAMGEILRNSEGSAAADTDMRSAHQRLVSLANELELTITSFEVRS